jgi:cell division protein FtsQ
MTTVQERSTQPGPPRGRPRLWIALATLGLVVVLAVGLVFFTSLFGVRSVSVRGVSQVPAAEIESVAAVRPGTPLLRLDTGAVRRRILAGVPGVSAVTVRRSFPGGVVITVQERRAVGYRSVNGGFELVDATDVGFRGVGTAPRSVPLLSSDGTAPSADAESTVAGSLLPAEARAVARVSAASPESVTLLLTDGRTVLWGGTDRGAEKATLLAVLMKQPGRYFDISDPGTVISRGPS